MAQVVQTAGLIGESHMIAPGICMHNPKVVLIKGDHP
jgi:hypothetical protein